LAALSVATTIGQMVELPVEKASHLLRMSDWDAGLPSGKGSNQVSGEATVPVISAAALAQAP
jgi:hypothetical protein